MGRDAVPQGRTGDHVAGTVNYWDALLIEQGDTITYTADGEEHTATVTGEIHDYGERPGQVVYVPIAGAMVNRLYITEVNRG